MKHLLITISLLTLSLPGAYAQPDKGGNGGKIYGSDLSTQIAELELFFRTASGAKQTFPEVDPVKFTGFKNCLTVFMRPYRPLDKFGQPQDAVNWKKCVIEVYSKAWEKIADRPELRFAFALHEMFGLLDIEVVRKAKDAQDYTHSSKIVYFVQPTNVGIGLVDVDLSKLHREQRFRIQCYHEQTVAIPRARSDRQEVAQPVADIVIRFDPEVLWSDQDLDLNIRGGIFINGKVGKPGKSLDFEVFTLDHIGPHLPEFSKWNRRRVHWAGANSSNDRLSFEMLYTPELASSSRSVIGGEPVSWTGSMQTLKMHFPRCPENAACQGWLKSSSALTHVQCSTQAEIEGKFVPADFSQLQALNWILNLGYELPQTSTQKTESENP